LFFPPNRRSLKKHADRSLPASPSNTNAAPVRENSRGDTVRPSFQYGDFIRFHTKIKKIQGFHNPGSFDYERSQNRRGLYVSGFVSDRACIVLIRPDTASGLKLKLERFRLYLKRCWKSTPPPAERNPAAMTIGDQKAIPQDVRDQFAKTGTSHICPLRAARRHRRGIGFFPDASGVKSSEYCMLKFNIIKTATAAAIVRF
jgi:competence protein ComEC